MSVVNREEWEQKRRHIAFILMRHPRNKEEFEEHREDILMRTGGNGVPTAFRSDSTVSNPTQNRAIELATNPYLLHLQRCVEAVDYVFDRLPEEHQDLVRKYYWSNRYDPAGDRSAATRFLVRNPEFPKSTFYRWNQEILVALGVELGYFNLPT